jgi:hypothetical protein
MFCLSCSSSPTALACQASCQLSRPVISCIGGGQSSANINLYGEVAYVLLKLLQLSHSPSLPGLMSAQQNGYILRGIGGGQSSAYIKIYLNNISQKLRGIFYVLYFIQHCFLCHLSDIAVSEDAGIEPRIVPTSALAIRRPNHSARSHPMPKASRWCVQSI